MGASQGIKVVADYKFLSKKDRPIFAYDDGEMNRFLSSRGDNNDDIDVQSDELDSLIDR